MCVAGGTLWRRVARADEDATAAYRKQIEDYLKQGLVEGAAARLSQALAIGSTTFIEKLRRCLAGCAGERTNARAWRRLMPFPAVVRAVETVHGIPWRVFAAQRGDWGRDLALYIGRMHGGMTLAELGAHAEMKLDTVSKAVMRMRRRLQSDKQLQRTRDRVLRMIGTEQVAP